MKATFYHAGCPVCISAENTLLSLLDTSKIEIEVVHLGDTPEKLQEAENIGVESVPALVVDSNVLHINFGAALSDLKK